jgi:hypothetical protein
VKTTVAFLTRAYFYSSSEKPGRQGLLSTLFYELFMQSSFHPHLASCCLLLGYIDHLFILFVLLSTCLNALCTFTYLLVLPPALYCAEGQSGSRTRGYKIQHQEGIWLRRTSSISVVKLRQLCVSQRFNVHRHN